jgi:L-alanine-DL-glutamate epimerase-like enolase superfamily enzyme
VLVAPDRPALGATDSRLSTRRSAGRIVGITLWLVELAYGARVDPYQWSAADDRRFLCVLAEVASETTSGFGEAGFIDTDPLVRAPVLLETWLDAAAPVVIGRPVEDFRALGAVLQADPLPAVENERAEELASWRTYHAGALTFGPLATAVESALWDLFAREIGVPLRTLYGPGDRRLVPVCPAIGRFDPREAGQLAAELAEEGFQAIKFKGGRGVALDLEILAAARETTALEVPFRLDPNGAYDVGQARRLIAGAAEYGLEYLEQPCPPGQLAETAALRRSSEVPIALDEEVVGPENIVQIHAAAAADVVLLELHAVGGLGRLLEAVATAKACGLPLGVHAAYSTGVRTAGVLHLVAAQPAFCYAPDTLYHDLREDVLATRLELVEGVLTVPTGPGLGVEVDREHIEALAVASATRTAEG